MAYMPCQNPECKSYGKPHPNCRCWDKVPAYAEGGEIFNCKGPHNPDCEYFAEGGEGPRSGEEVPLDAVDDKEVHDPGPPGLFTPKGTRSGEEVPLDAVDDNPYSTPGQQTIAGVEGAARGLLPIVSTAAELGLGKLGVPGMSQEDITGREKANPGTHLAGATAGLAAGLFFGTGEIGLALKGAEAISEATIATELGAKVVSGMISSGAIQGENEISKAMLGQGDPEAPVSSALVNVGAATLLGGVLPVAGKGIEELKLGSRLSGYLTGLGVAANVPAAQAAERALLIDSYTKKVKAGLFRGDLKSFTSAIKHYDKLVSGGGGFMLGSMEGYREHGLDPYEIIKTGIMGALIGAGTGRIATLVSKHAIGPVLGPALLKALQSNKLNNLVDLLDHAQNVSQGTELFGRGVGSLFKAGAQSSIAPTQDKIRKSREELDNLIKNNQFQQDVSSELNKSPAEAPPQFAEGGEVDIPKPEPSTGINHNQGLADVYPEQNVMMNAAKSRITGYLKNLRPSDIKSKLPFDTAQDDVEATKTYHRALDIANYPLSVVDHINKGTLIPEHIKHLTSMYPEVTNQLQKKITEEVTKAQLKDEKPSYKVRQGLSMLMGTSLDSTLLPANMQAAQAVFQKQQAQQQQPQGKSKGSSKALSKTSQQYQTSDQARAERQQKG